MNYYNYGSEMCNGRLCIFGEHTDWAAKYGMHNGSAVVVPLQYGIKALFSYSNKLIVRNNDIIKFSMSIVDDCLYNEAKNLGNYYRFCCATIVVIRKYFYNVKGLNINIIRQDLPISKGLSSSSAICLLVVSGYNKIYNLNLCNEQIMDIAYEAEILSGNNCGKMDQVGILPKKLYLLEFDAYNRRKIKEINKKNTYYFFVIILNGEKNTYKILYELNKSYKSDKRLQYYLGELNRCIINDAVKYFNIGDILKIGKLMNFAQKEFNSMVVPCAPTELKSDNVDCLIKDMHLNKFLYGCKGVGSHGDVSLLCLAKSYTDMKNAIIYVNQKYRYSCYKVII